MEKKYELRYKGLWISGEFTLKNHRIIDSSENIVDKKYLDKILEDHLRTDDLRVEILEWTSPTVIDLIKRNEYTHYSMDRCKVFYKGIEIQRKFEILPPNKIYLRGEDGVPSLKNMYTLVTPELLEEFITSH